MKKGLPIAIGYLSVSFTFGVKSSKCRNSCVDYDFDFCCQCNICRTVCRSGNYGTHGSYLEMAMTTFIINVRYMLMSFSLSQKVDKKMTLRRADDWLWYYG